MEKKSFPELDHHEFDSMESYEAAVKSHSKAMQKIAQVETGSPTLFDLIDRHFPEPYRTAYMDPETVYKTARAASMVKLPQGISKAGNKRIRALSVEIAWAWLRFQSNSKLSDWYMKKFGCGRNRLRRIGIVALARLLLIALWRYLENGVVPESAYIKPIA